MFLKSWYIIFDTFNTLFSAFQFMLDIAHVQLLMFSKINKPHGLYAACDLYEVHTGPWR